MFGDSIRPRHVWTPQWHRLVVLVKQMVIALIVVMTCIKPQHNCQTYVGTKKMKNYEIQTKTETSPWSLAPNNLLKSLLGLCCNNRNCNNMSMHWAHMIVQLINLFLITHSLISLGLNHLAMTTRRYMQVTHFFTQ
jgi:hypothetical protein